ncbi:serine/threonine-protein kinase [Corynebacterium caspium]|uniref:serine/threonine-protein kinase n=1 Tax=Corynebacterium caspium TaxID=234828 RepID=UPI000373B1C9|nr:serine/threonine-protein kinase [Corynebacterium caspium]WKD58475.1 Serine/threonine-protein kinase PknA [Corynebacterium caspium DSM 44850]
MTGRHNSASNGASADRDRLQALIGDAYRLQWVIGHGGMSTVWLADDTIHDREVAIKVLRPEYSNSAEFLERFRNEAAAAQKIHSRNVVATYDYQEIPEENGMVFCFIVMEFIRGEALSELLARQGALPEDTALQIIEQAAHGLGAIHNLGMIHRDIKPGNIMITEHGVAKIADFGIAKAAAATPLTRTGMVVGTAQYVSPEQAQGLALAAASDVYSLGVVAYEALAGKRPFSGDSSVSVVLAHINNQAAPLSTTISAQTRELVNIALRKDPMQRFRTGDQFASAIAAVRLGNRPADPRGYTGELPAAENATSVFDPQAVTQATQIVPPTSATAMGLQTSQAAQAAQAARAAQARQAQQARQVPAPPPKSSQGFFLGLAAAVIVLLLVAGGIYAASQTSRRSEITPSTTPVPTTALVITQTVTPTPTPVTPTTTKTQKSTTESPSPSENPDTLVEIPVPEVSSTTSKTSKPSSTTTQTQEPTSTPADQAEGGTETGGTGNTGRTEAGANAPAISATGGAQ